jgi:uncharacterized protein YacL
LSLSLTVSCATLRLSLALGGPSPALTLPGSILLLIGLRISNLLIPRLYRRAIGVDCICWLLLATLPVIAISLLAIRFLRLLIVFVLVVVIQKLRISMRCCARNNYAICRSLVSRPCDE